MKRFQYENYIAGETIFTPFQLDYQRISLSASLPTSLAQLFPSKATFFAQKNPGMLTVSLVPDAPFGPSPNLLRESFLADFHRALFEVKEFFGLPSIELISPEHPFQNENSAITWSNTFNKRHSQGIILALFEFATLYRAAIHEQYSESVLLSILININTVFCLHVPQRIPLQNILLLLQTEHYLKFPRTSQPFHPLLRRMLDPEHETTGHRLTLVMLTHSGYIVRAIDHVFRKFPYFHRPIGIREGTFVEHPVLPCTHCLACSRYCPAGLFPSVLYQKSHQGKKAETVALNINACIQCGKCNFVCPANLPLCETIIHTIRELKNRGEYGNH